jgi:hypothetical protein
MASLAPENSNAVKRLLLRTAAILDEETRLLNSNPRADVTELASRKNRCLYELSTALREFGTPRQNMNLDSELEVLKTSVEENERALSVNIKASQDVVAILGKLANENLNDGTYSNGYR